jgi:hypothetical protein
MREQRICGRSIYRRQREGWVCFLRCFQFYLPVSLVGNKPPVSRAAPQSEAKVFSKFIVVGMPAVRRGFPDSERAPISRVSSFAEGCAQMKSRTHAGEDSSSFETRVPNKAPEPTSGTVMPPAEPGVTPVPPVAHL